MEMLIGYVVGYHPENATIDIRSADGTKYDALAFDSSLAFYCTPVLPIMRTEAATGAVRAVKIGSFVMFMKFDDSSIRIVRIFNDDQDILKNFPGHATRPIHGFVQDTLLAMLQDGEALIQAPGRIIETSSDIFERKMGSWMLFKNSGDAILSNADSSCEMFVSNTGQWEITATKIRLRGSDTEIVEDDQGDLYITSGAQRGQPVKLIMSSNYGTATLSSGTTTMTVSEEYYSLSSGFMNLSAGNEMNLSTTAFNLAASTIVASANSVAVSGADSVTASAPAVNVAAGATATISAGQAVVINAPKNNIVVDQNGTTLTLDADTKLTIIIGEAKLLMSKDGVTLVPPPGKVVGIGENASQQVLITGTVAAGPGVVFTPVYSTLLKVAS
jgi:hypothetical protein